MTQTNTCTYIPLTGRIDSRNAAEVEKNIFAAEFENAVILDARHLYYISSAGLRILLKIRKKTKNVSIINVNPAVYEVLDMTGFSSMFTVEKALRPISPDGYTKLSGTASAHYYRLDAEKVLRLFPEEVSLPDILTDIEHAKQARTAGIPAAIPCETVSSGNCYGNIYESVSATLAEALTRGDDDYDEYIEKYASLVKTMAGINVPDNMCPQIRDVLLARITPLANILGENDFALLKRLVGSMKTAGHLLHGSLLPGNILIQNGQLVLPDLGEAACGSAIYELTSIYHSLCALAKTAPAFTESACGLSAAAASKVWNDFLCCYLGTDDPQQLQRYTNSLALLQSINAVVALTDLAPEAGDFQATLAQVKKSIIDGILIPYETCISYMLSTM